jgi:hypothetical protein
MGEPRTAPHRSTGISRIAPEKLRCAAPTVPVAAGGRSAPGGRDPAGIARDRLLWFQFPLDRSCEGSNCDPPYQIQRQSLLDQLSIDRGPVYFIFSQICENHQCCIFCNEVNLYMPNGK